LIGYTGSDGIPIGTSSLEGLENLQEISRELWLANLPITTLAPLQNVRVRWPSQGPNYSLLQVVDCDYLETLDGLELGPDIGRLSIADNDRLTTLDALKLDQSPRSLYEIDLGNNPRLLDLDVFATVTELSSLTLSYLPQTDLSAFPALRRVGEYIALFDNGALATVTFPNLESVRTLAIDSNEVLAELELPSLGEITDALRVRGNPLLPSSRIEPLRALAPSADITGNRDDPAAP
jgi:hypothetical protein